MNCWENKDVKKDLEEWNRRSREGWKCLNILMVDINDER